jgi:hypothetical protein
VAADGGLVAVMKGAWTVSVSAPRMGERPLSPPPQPAAINVTKTAADHGRYFEKRGISCIIFPGGSGVDRLKKKHAQNTLNRVWSLDSLTAVVQALDNRLDRLVRGYRSVKAWKPLF